MNKKFAIVLVGTLIFSMATGCTKKEDPEIAALKARLDALTAELAADDAEEAEPEATTDRRRGERGDGERRGRRNKAEVDAEIAAVQQQLQDAQTSAPTTKPATTNTNTTSNTSTGSTSTTTTTTSTPSASNASSLPVVLTGTAQTANGGTVTFSAVQVPNGGGVVILPEQNKNKGITSLTIPNGVTGIDHEAFANNRITSLTIPPSVTYILDQAFLGNQLTTITIPASVDHIGGGAFSNNKLTSATVNARLVDGFSYNQLTSVSIGNNVQEINRQTFQNNQLRHVYIPASVKEIGFSAFLDNPLESVTFESADVIIYLGDPRNGLLRQKQAEQREAGGERGISTYAFPDGESLDEQYTYRKGGAGTYIRKGNTWSKASYTLDAKGNRVFQQFTTPTYADGNIYAEASSNSNVIRAIPQGTNVTVTGDNGSGWYSVEYGGVKGWILISIANK